MSARFWPLATLLLGLATLGVLIGFSYVPDVRVAYQGDFALALSAFQRATSMEDLYALFGNPPDGIKLAAMTAGNSLDLHAFIPVYCAFLIAAAAMLAGGLRKWLAWPAILAVLVGAAADVVETQTQLTITTEWHRAAEVLPQLAPACWTKFFGLAVHAMGCSLICFAGEKKRWLFGALGFLPIAGVFADWAGAIHVPALMTGVFGFFWLGLLVVAIAGLLGKRGPVAA